VGDGWLIFGLPPRKLPSIRPTRTTCTSLPHVRRRRGAHSGDEKAQR
jgi:hypothetical protein